MLDLCPWDAPPDHRGSAASRNGNGKHAPDDAWDAVRAAIRARRSVEAYLAEMGAERRGGYGKYLCPFHTESSPSFWTFDTDDGDQRWTCGHGTAPVGRFTRKGFSVGDVIDLYAYHTGCTVGEATARLATELGIPLPASKMWWDFSSQGADQPDRSATPPNQQPPRISRTDTGNGRRLVAAKGDLLRYCWLWERWLWWDTLRWQTDSTGAVWRFGKEIPPMILREAADAPDEDERKALAKWAITSESEHAIQAMIRLARSEPGIPVTPAELDADPWKLTVRNGTLNLKTGELGPHRREDLITRLADVDYNPAATCPRFLAFLHTIMDGDEDLIAFLKRAIGSSLTGDTSDRAMFIAWGSGGNGKTTLFDVIRHLLGEYALRTPTETLLAKRDGLVPNDVARLKGARFVYASEAEEGRRLAESFVKDLTGGDTISARFMRSEWFDFTPECKVWLATNHKPVIRGSDNAIWDRLKLIPFTVTIPLEQRIPRRVLMAELTAELSGILRWAVEGCLEWQRNGLGEPSAVQQATKDYRSAMDVVGAFLADCCVLAPAASVTVKVIYTAYVSWCETNHEKPLSKNMFGARLAERELKPIRVGASQDRGWLGVKLKPTDQTDTDTPKGHFQDD